MYDLTVAPNGGGGFLINIRVLITAGSGSHGIHSIRVSDMSGISLLDMQTQCGRVVDRTIQDVQIRRLPIRVQVTECDERGRPLQPNLSGPFLTPQPLTTDDPLALGCSPLFENPPTSACLQAQGDAAARRNEVLDACRQMRSARAKRNGWTAAALIAWVIAGALFAAACAFSTLKPAGDLLIIAAVIVTIIAIVLTIGFILAQIKSSRAQSRFNESSKVFDNTRTRVMRLCCNPNVDTSPVECT